MNPLALIPVLGPAVEKLLNLIPDPNARAKAEAEFQRQLLQAAMDEGKDQRAVNLEEARHQSLFVAGWRPAIGWGCGFCILYGYVLQPLLAWGVAVHAPQYLDRIPVFPMEHVWELIFALLGVGSLRTLEKVKGLRR